jgi:hypothetical protein
LFPDQKQHKGHFTNQRRNLDQQLVGQEEGESNFGNIGNIIWTANLAFDYWSGYSCGNDWALSTVVASVTTNTTFLLLGNWSID